MESMSQKCQWHVGSVSTVYLDFFIYLKNLISHIASKCTDKDSERIREYHQVRYKKKNEVLMHIGVPKIRHLFFFLPKINN